MFVDNNGVLDLDLDLKFFVIVDFDVDLFCLGFFCGVLGFINNG